MPPKRTASKQSTNGTNIPRDNVTVLPKRGADGNREKLLRAAQKLFATQGLANTQVAQITGEAGTGISMFYRHFKDKNDVLRCLVESFLDEIDTQLADALSGIERQSTLEQLFSVRKLYQHVIELLVSRPELTVNLYQAGFGGEDDIEALVRTRVNKLALDIASHLSRAEAAGIVNIKHKEVLGHAIVGLALQVSQKIILEGTPAIDEAVETCTRFTLGGVLLFAPPNTFDQLFPALRFMLQPALGLSTAQPEEK